MTHLEAAILDIAFETPFKLRTLAMQKAIRNLMVRLLADQGGRCAFCDHEIRFYAGNSPKGRSNDCWVATLDHFLPRERGGLASVVVDPVGGVAVPNFVAACRGCNGAKGDLMPLEYAAAKAGFFDKAIAARRTG